MGVEESQRGITQSPWTTKRMNFPVGEAATG